MGSLLAAIISRLDARRHAGQWLVRMEDLDRQRTVAGAADRILQTLEALGFEWDGEVVYQSTRTHLYESAFDQLQQRGMLYPCDCSRREIADSATSGIEGPVYPGTCRNKSAVPGTAHAWRVRTGNDETCISDEWQGRICQRLATDIGDFVVKRADGFFAYQLAVVVDDADQRISHVVRGNDLLLSTPRQAYLQALLSLPTPFYRHFPLLLDQDGRKLSKQSDSAAVDIRQPLATLLHAFELLGMAPLPQPEYQSIEEAWHWAEQCWDPALLASRKFFAIR